jgi:hypothetical protein
MRRKPANIAGASFFIASEAGIAITYAANAVFASSLAATSFPYSAIIAPGRAFVGRTAIPAWSTARLSGRTEGRRTGGKTLLSFELEGLARGTHLFMQTVDLRR